MQKRKVYSLIGIHEESTKSWYLRLTSPNGREVFESKPYTRKENMLRLKDSLMNNLFKLGAAVYEEV